MREADRPHRHGLRALPRLSERQLVARRRRVLRLRHLDEPPAPDTTPPAAPTGLLATAGTGQVSLSWAANAEPDLAGYFLYRNGALVNVVPMTGTSYTDLGLSYGTYSYQLSAVDSSSNEGAKSAPAVAMLSAPPAADMALTTEECSVCHDFDHGDPPPCLDCHSFGEFHSPTVADLHTPADVTGCESCHDASLTIEHKDRTPDAGGTFDCETCHASADALVTAAIAAGNSACVACHPSAGHADAHVSATADNSLAGTTEVCGECHDADVQVEHAKSGSSSAAAGCVACHPTPRDTLSPWDKETCVQGGCHVAGSAAAMHGNEAADHFMPLTHSGCLQVGCHGDEWGNESIADLHATAAMPSTTSKVDAGFE